MSTKNTFLSSQNLTTNPKSVESRKAVFKIFSETLRPASRTPENRKSVSKPNLPKINKKSPRTIAGGGFKSGFPSFQPPLGSSSSAHSPFFSVIPSKVNNTSNKQIHTKYPKSNKNVPGGCGEGNYIPKSASHDQTSPKAGAARQPTPSIKNCHLNNVLRSANRCLSELRVAKENLTELVAQDEQLSRGIKKQRPTEDQLQLASVALSITNLCREAFVPAHRLNQTGIALYTAEDFLRYPSDIRSYDMQNPKGRVKLPDMTFNSATVMKLRQVVDLAAATYNKFNPKGRLGADLQEILFCVLRGYQDFYAAALGCQEIFKVLLYAGAKDKAHLQQFLLALSGIERSDLLIEIQDLRRILDEIVIFLEKLSWGSFIIHRLAGGDKQSSASQNDDIFPISKSTTALPTYPAYPLLRGKVPSSKKKKKKAMGTMGSAIDLNQFRLDARGESSLSNFSTFTEPPDQDETVNNTKRGSSNNAKCLSVTSRSTAAPDNDEVNGTDLDLSVDELLQSKF